MSTSQQFFRSAGSESFTKVLELYPKVLELRANKISKTGGKKTLLDLDKWYQNDLPQIIASREEKFITKEELTKLMKWKLARGKFRPRLTELVQTNDEKLVESASRTAFKSVTKSLKKAIKDLCVLKAVGPATASAILAAGAPDKAPFMADEGMNSVPGLGPLKYTEHQYEDYAKEIIICMKRLNSEGEDEWTPHKIELTLWTHYLAQQINPKLLDCIKSEKRSAEDNQENNTKKAKKT